MASSKSAGVAGSGGGPKPKAPQLCKVSFGYQSWVLPADKGLALVGLLKDAVPVTYVEHGSTGPQFKAATDEDVTLSLEILKPGQFIPSGPTLH